MRRRCGSSYASARAYDGGRGQAGLSDTWHFAACCRRRRRSRPGRASALTSAASPPARVQYAGEASGGERAVVFSGRALGRGALERAGERGESIVAELQRGKRR